MRQKRAPAFVLPALAALPLALPAAAQEAATAAALFDRGVSEMQAGRFETACPALAESQRVEPRPGTLFTLAECERKWGRVASAVGHYEDYLGIVSRLPPDQQQRHADRARSTAETLRYIKPTVPTLALVLPANAPAGTLVTRDQVVLQGAALGLPLPVDPGEHVIVTRAPDGPDHVMRVTVALAEAKQLELEVVVPIPPAAVPVPAPVPPPPAPVASTPAPPAPAPAPREQPKAQQRTWAYVAGGVGAAGIVTGSIAGALVLGKKSTVNRECTGHSCSAGGVDAANSGQTLATVSTVGFAVGLAGLATGAVLLLTAPRAHAEAGHARVTPLVGGDRRGAWAGIAARF